MRDTYYRFIRWPHHDLTILMVKKWMDKKPKGTVASRSIRWSLSPIATGHRRSQLACMLLLLLFQWCCAFKSILAAP